MAFDLVIRGGTIVTADETFHADIGVAGGLITHIGEVPTGKHEVDATNQLVFPGGIDAHVHLSQPARRMPRLRWVDDFTSGSGAALAGGITTLGNMSFPWARQTPLMTLARDSALVEKQAIADFILHPVLAEAKPNFLADIPRLLEVGCNSMKIFMTVPWFDRQIMGFMEAVRRAGERGLLTLIHCEDSAIIGDSTARLMQSGRSNLRYFGESRPVAAEVVATQRAIAIAEVTGAPIYIVHLSSRRALDVCAEAQSRGIPVFVETRPLYLHLTEERLQEPDGPKYIGQPPLRTSDDTEAIWSGIREGIIHTVCTDHAPWSLEAKLDPALTVAQVRPGVENLQTMLPMLYSEGVRTGRISLQRFVEITSTNAARLFGLYPRKGAIRVGSDADLVIFDPNQTQVIENSMLKSNADYSVYEGWEVTGWPTVTIRRGEIVFQNDEVIGRPGSGRLLRREATAPL